MRRGRVVISNREPEVVEGSGSKKTAEQHPFRPLTTISVYVVAVKELIIGADIVRVAIIMMKEGLIWRRL
jgi:hypothetical protein